MMLSPDFGEPPSSEIRITFAPSVDARRVLSGVVDAIEPLQRGDLVLGYWTHPHGVQTACLVSLGDDDVEGGAIANVARVLARSVSSTNTSSGVRAQTSARWPIERMTENDVAASAGARPEIRRYPSSAGSLTLAAVVGRDASAVCGPEASAGFIAGLRTQAADRGHAAR
jgi:hypothetical protein